MDWAFKARCCVTYIALKDLCDLSMDAVSKMMLTGQPDRNNNNNNNNNNNMKQRRLPVVWKKLKMHYPVLFDTFKIFL